MHTRTVSARQPSTCPAALLTAKTVKGRCAKLIDASALRSKTDVNMPNKKRVWLNDSDVKRSRSEVKFFDTFNHQLLTNHYIDIYHRASVNVCDLVFDDKGAG